MDSHRDSIHPASRVASSPLSSAAVLPEQFFARPAGNATGELALMGAVLEDALYCFQQQLVSPQRRARRLAEEDEAWFFVDDPGWPFSFINICSALGLDPAAIRRELRRWPQAAPSMPRKRKHHRVPAHDSKVAA